MLPRNGLEAARDRKTEYWTGDVYKAVEILRRRRPDLVVLLVNTAPTGTAVVVGVDQASTILRRGYEEELEYLVRPDPQDAATGVSWTAPSPWSRTFSLRHRCGRNLWLTETAASSADLGGLWDQLRQLQPQERSLPVT